MKKQIDIKQPDQRQTDEFKMDRQGQTERNGQKDRGHKKNVTEDGKRISEKDKRIFN